MNKFNSISEHDYQRTVISINSGWYLQDSDIEIIREPQGRGEYRFALFDFDGTLSLLREGWPDVMLPMMVKELLKTPQCEPEDELRNNIQNLISHTTGKQTIYQMMDFCNEIIRRGGNPLDPMIYKKRYLQLLMERITSRLEGLRQGNIKAEDMLVPGSYAILDALRKKDIQMFLASGTDEYNVREEADLLGLTPYFGKNIYGAIQDYTNYSKAQVIERMLSKTGVSGSKLLGFGDGYVEIDNTRAVGGTTIGVASNEAERNGKPDMFKRDRLIGVGADIVIPDFSSAHILVDYLFGASN